MSNTTNHSSPQDSGSFLTGLGLGLLGGAVGYFLFATDKGADIRKKLAKEWQTAEKLGADKLVDEAIGDNTLLKSVKSFFGEVLEKARKEQAEVEEQKQKKKIKKKKQLFKGSA